MYTYINNNIKLIFILIISFTKPLLNELTIGTRFEISFHNILIIGIFLLHLYNTIC